MKIEPLENRIAPATLFISHADYTIEDAAGTAQDTAPNETDARNDASSTRAVLLSAGDTLIFDFNDAGGATPHVFEPALGDLKLITVTGASAMVFFTDLDGSTGFDLDEITGLAVANKFNGTVFGDVGGSIVTALDAAGNFTPTTLQNSAIAGLTVLGKVEESLFSGGNMANVRVGHGLYGTLGNTADYSVNVIGTGTLASGSTINWNGAPIGGSFVLDPFTPAPGAAGGSISKMTLENGARFLRTGEGGDVVTGTAGAGGSISDLTIPAGFGEIDIVTGVGGDANTSGTGGAGGKLSKSQITIVGSDSTGGINITARQGGASSNGSGGAGGAIEKVTFAMLGNAAFIEVEAGKGGFGTTKGGAGGAITGSSFTAGARLGSFDGGNNPVDGQFEVRAGGGGNSAIISGAGGKIAMTTVQALGEVIESLTVGGGDAGFSTGGKGAAGGALDKVTVRSTAVIGVFNVNSGQSEGSVVIAGGTGGAGFTAAGVGGAITGSKVELLGDYIGTQSRIAILGGQGGALQPGAGLAVVAGTGGAIKGLNVTVGDFANSPLDADVLVSAGKGGLADGQGDGGVGGALTGLRFTGTGVALGSIELSAGDGNNAGAAGNGKGGAGGITKDVIVNWRGDMGGSNFLDVVGGQGGTGRNTGSGGAGGATSKVIFNVTGRINGVEAFGGDGGNGGANGAGGAGSTLSSVTLNASGEIGTAEFDGGIGGQGFGSGAGGNGGTVSGVTVKNSGSQMTYYSFGGTGGDGGTTGAGGKGGDTMKESLTGNFVRISVESGDGGAAGGAMSGGKAGNIAGLFVDAAATTAFGDALGIFGGEGGSNIGGSGGGGDGGSINGAMLRHAGLIERDIEILAGKGGNAGPNAGAGITAGRGGNATGVNLFALGAINGTGTTSAVSVSAGNGGDGGANGSSGGGRGGDLSKLFVQAGALGNDFLITAGRGGNAFQMGKSGDGGNASGITVKATSGITAGDFKIGGGGGGQAQLGNGGNSGTFSKINVALGFVQGATDIFPDSGGVPIGGGATGSGGAGGNLTGVTFSAAAINALQIFAANGGGGPSVGANGGTASKINVTVGSASVIEIGPGNGGSAIMTGNGGTGGALKMVKVNAGNVSGGFVVNAGFGGSGGNNGGDGGDGGAMSAVTITGTSVGNFLLIGGGAGGVDGTGTAGNGGPIDKATVTFTGAATNGLFIRGGEGGDVFATGTGSGGAGGKVSKVTLVTGAVGTTGVPASAQITGGNAGDSRGANAKPGGAVSAVLLQNNGFASSDVSIRSGQGGDVITGAGSGGDSGAITGATIRNIGGAFNAVIQSDDGGNGTGAGGNGGDGGDVSGALIDSFADLQLGSIGSTGGGSSSSGAAGDGGDVTGAKIDHRAGEAFFTVFSGFGGNSSLGTGGDSGAVSKVVLNGPAASFYVGMDDGSTPIRGGFGSTGGGNGRNVSGISSTAGVGELSIFAPSGGTATNSGPGGDGGSIIGVNISQAGSFVRKLLAGDGGAAVSDAGNGGSVMNVSVNGDIGDFAATSPFDMQATASIIAMGGIAAGQGGAVGFSGPDATKNGSVSNITARRIAAIIAGRISADDFTSNNFVRNLSGISALVLGADVNGDGDFDFVDVTAPPTFTVLSSSAGDNPIDGLVFVRAAGLSPLPVPPLLLLTI